MTACPFPSGYARANPTYVLVIFDRRTGQPPIAERTASTEQLSRHGRHIWVVRA